MWVRHHGAAGTGGACGGQRRGSPWPPIASRSGSREDAEQLGQAVAEFPGRTARTASATRCAWPRSRSASGRPRTGRLAAGRRHRGDLRQAAVPGGARRRSRSSWWRVVRAFVWKRNSSRQRASRAAARSGQASTSASPRSACWDCPPGRASAPVADADRLAPGHHSPSGTAVGCGPARAGRPARARHHARSPGHRQRMVRCR